MMNSMISIPEDVLINRILLKLDTESLIKLRCVCKYLRSIITSPAFVKMHYHDQFNNHPLVLVYWDKHLYCSLNFNGTDPSPSRPQRVEVVSPFSSNTRFFGSCNGLLCLVEGYNSPPSLWNPTTKEYKKLPPPLPASVKNLFGNNVSKLLLWGSVAYGFGYDRIIDDYKVIQYENFSQRQNGFNIDGGYSTTEFQVYTLGTNTWTRINDNQYESYSMPPYQYPHQVPGMLVNGALHWIVIDKEGSIIIAFDIEKEMFLPEVPKSHSLSRDFYYNGSLHVLRGCLCIYEELQHGCTDVWMMKEYGVKDSWTKLCAIKDFCAHAFLGLDLKVLNVCDNGEVLVLIDNATEKKLILYDPINKKHRPVMVGEIGDIFYKEIHTESLVSLNTGIYMHGLHGMVKNKHSEEIKMKRKRLRNDVLEDY